MSPLTDRSSESLASPGFDLSACRPCPVRVRLGRAARVGLALLACVDRPQAAADSPAPRTNVVLVMVDDLGWGDPGFNGGTRARTPHLDRLAASGLVLERFYAAAPVCSPTRASCLTGRHPFRCGILHANVGHLPEGEITIPELLEPEGYRCGHFGKWHLGTLTVSESDSNRGGPKGAAHFSPPRRHGFHASFATEAKVPTFDPMLRPPGAGTTWWDAIPEGERDAAVPFGTAYWNHDGSRASESLDGDDSRIIVDRALEFITGCARDGTPFFATVWLHAPHLPVVAAPADAGLYPEASGHERNYFGCITALDREVGRLWSRLGELGVASDTLLVFSSDNGPEGRAGRFPGSAGPLRGRKRDLFEGGIRVPAFAVWPNGIEAGRRTRFPVVTSDLLPTIADLAGVAPPSDRPLDGTSVAGVLAGSEPPAREAPIFFRSERQIAVIDHAVKLVSTDQGRTWQLFDLDADEAEANDLAGGRPEEVRGLRDLVEAWMAGLPDGERAGPR